MAVDAASGTLFVVATPIGNLGDLAPRALQALRGVAAICAEDTRHTRQLLGHFGIEQPLLALHEHNEESQAIRWGWCRTRARRWSAIPVSGWSARPVRRASA